MSVFGKMSLQILSLHFNMGWAVFFFPVVVVVELCRVALYGLDISPYSIQDLQDFLGEICTV